MLRAVLSMPTFLELLLERPRQPDPAKIGSLADGSFVLPSNSFGWGHKKSLPGIAPISLLASQHGLATSHSRSRWQRRAILLSDVLRAENHRFPSRDHNRSRLGRRGNWKDQPGREHACLGQHGCWGRPSRASACGWCPGEVPGRLAPAGQSGRVAPSRRRWRRRVPEARQQTSTLRPMYSRERRTLIDDDARV
jgi:hypothetical protein